MILQSYSIPQLILNSIIKEILCTDTTYNDRTIIKPLEIDVYVDEYKIGFEYDGKGWHTKPNDKIKRCGNLDITLFTFVENSRNYETDVKTQLCDIVPELNKLCNKNITCQQIMNVQINYDEYLFDKADIKIICARYTDFTLFTREQKYLYSKLRKLNLLDEYTVHMIRNHIKWDADLLKDEISKYDRLSEFIDKSGAAYNYVKKHKLDHLLCSLARAKRTLSYEICLDYIIAKKPVNKAALKRNDGSIYRFLKRKIGLTQLGKLITDQ